MESDADRLATIQSVGGQLVITSSVQFWAIFDRQYLSVATSDLEIESRSPALACRSSDIPEITKDDQLRIGSATYRLLRAEPDTPAPGWTTLVLRA